MRWVRGKYALHQSQAIKAIRLAVALAGPERVSVLRQRQRRTDVVSLLEKAEQKWPGVLMDLTTDSHRRVAERHGAVRGSIWSVRCLLKELCEITGLDERDTIKSVLGRRRR